MMEQKYMEDIAQFLHDMKWIYDFHVTKIFTKDIFSQMPEDWKGSLLNLPVHTLNGIPQGKTQDDWPLSLRVFLEKCQKFSLQNLTRTSCEDDPEDVTGKVPQTLTRGLSEKKRHEVLSLLKLTERIANVTGSNYVLDIGSGLGYIDSILHHTLKLTVVGAESLKDRVKSATERQTRLFTECSGVRHIHWELTDDEETLIRAHREVVEMMKADVTCTCKEEKLETRKPLENQQSSIPVSYVTDTSQEDHHVEENSSVEKSAILIGLHSCADLSPIMLKVFQGCPQLSSLILFSCCYHKLTPEKLTMEENQSNKENCVGVTDETVGTNLGALRKGRQCPSSHNNEELRVCKFMNFPLSNALKTILSQKKISFSTFGLRLAAQESGLRWVQQTEKEHETHRNSVAYRAILEAVCDKDELAVKRLRRHTRKSSFDTFEEYINTITTNYKFVPADSSSSVDDSEENCSRQEKQDITVDFKQTSTREHISEELTECYKRFEHLFPLIEPLTGLQLALQPVMEALILIDRVSFLKEAGFYNVSLEKVFDVAISPRNVALVAVR
ncbi:probable methyltransferase-like protein 25 [Penaeus chinensis]|uniref:probable methyltransferase-like protein 25 n=1 Tax=Penaeus chinensis TaxID=139456 RepID=UPI001FB72AE6|nr:probable methyltransferase-like protein 25 [Penaeus chinensis]XP_047487494.1 probable methyltransferase-like protein 25 [Penaeus chinensis]XP_047487495.1 probable methyltransferase-like protein 25 [Penaeus chinensis]XP_047487496.1 probable methyltransferase-like protein 25 [Penaeus chinensis]XP_047487497.1 probable methyltransferase-like protein 25 [Penaeus chinensis]